MFDTAAVRRSFSAAAGHYGRAAVLQREVEDRLLERLGFIEGFEPELIVDLGAGPGRACSALATRYGSAQVVALDLAEAMLEQIPATTPMARVCADAHFLPLADASCDLVFSSLMLQWCPDVGQVLNEARRVLKPNGVLLFSSFGPDTLKELRSAWASVDAGSHVSGFIDMHHLGDGLLATGLADPVMDMETITLTYAQVGDLMRELKAWGAHNMRADRSRGLTGKGRLRGMLEAYEMYRQEDGRIPATFEIVYGFARGAAPGQPTRSADGEEASFSVSHLRQSRRKS